MAHSSIPQPHSGYMRLPSSNADLMEAAKPLVSSPDTYLIDTLVPEDPKQTTFRSPATPAGLAISEWASWTHINAGISRLHKASTATTARIFLDYLAYCITAAPLCVLCTFVSTFLGALVLALIREPYATYGGTIVGAGATGGALLSVAPTTIAWAYNRLETAYERKYEIYIPQESLPRYLRHNLKDEEPQLAHRYRSTVFKWCGIVAVPVCGMAGPAIGVLILNACGVAQGVLSLVHGATCGGAGLCVIAVIAVIVKSVDHVTGCCSDDDD